MQDIKQQLFNILETNYGHIEINARKELEDLLSLAVEQERERIWEETKKISWRVSSSSKCEYNVHRAPLKAVIFNQQ